MFDSRGIIIPFITPYDDAGRVSAERAEALFNHQLSQGIDTFYIGGSSGECYLQSLDERTEFLRIMSRINQGRAKLIAHIGAISTPNSLQLGHSAEELGYDAVSSTPPFYYGFTRDQVLGFYRLLVDDIELPMILYNAPAVTNVDFSLSDLDELLSWEGVVGLKHTTLNMTVIERLKQLQPDKLIYHGEDYMLVTGALMGADGGIGSTYNVMPGKYRSLWQCVESGDFVTAKRIQSQINDVIDVLLKPGFLAGIKGMLKLQGFDVGRPREPFTWLNEQDWQSLQEAKERHEL